MTQKTFRLDPNPSGMTPSQFLEPGSFTSQDTHEANLFVFASEDQSLLSGVWECAPAQEAYPDGYPVNEMMHVISGSVTISQPDGTSETFAAGDTFFIPKGRPYVWENTEPMRKFYMIAS